MASLSKIHQFKKHIFKKHQIRRLRLRERHKLIRKSLQFINIVENLKVTWTQNLMTIIELERMHMNLFGDNPLHKPVEMVELEEILIQQRTRRTSAHSNINNLGLFRIIGMTNRIGIWLKKLKHISKAVSFNQKPSQCTGVPVFVLAPSQNIVVSEAEDSATHRGEGLSVKSSESCSELDSKTQNIPIEVIDLTASPPQSTFIDECNYLKPEIIDLSSDTDADCSENHKEGRSCGALSSGNINIGRTLPPVPILLTTNSATLDFESMTVRQHIPRAQATLPRRKICSFIKISNDHEDEMSSPGGSKRRRDLDVFKLMESKFDVTISDHNPSHLFVKFHGPPDTCYEGGVWRVFVNIPEMYPYVSPSVGFQNKIFHPNIEERSGSVCLDVIGHSWTPMYDLFNIFDVFLPQLLTYPNPTDPLNPEAANMHLQSPERYKTHVQSHIRSHATEEEYQKLVAQYNSTANANSSSGTEEESELSDLSDTEAEAEKMDES